MAANTETVTYRRKSQSQVNRDRKRAEIHRANQNVNNCDEDEVNQASDFIASSMPVTSAVSSDLSVAVCHISAPVPRVNKPPDRCDPKLKAREKQDHMVRAKPAVTRVKIHPSQRQQEHVTRTTTTEICVSPSNLGLRIDTADHHHPHPCTHDVVPALQTTITASGMNELESTLTEFLRQQSDNFDRLQNSIADLGTSVSECLPPHLQRRRYDH
jgi:hypothetical protein